MKKPIKQLLIVLSAALAINYMALHVFAADDHQGTAMYIQNSSAPAIDGVIDPIWGVTGELTSKNNYYDSNNGMAYGYSKIIWTEDALYLLAVITDPVMQAYGTDNTINGVIFLVSETASSQTAYGTIPGDWEIGVNPSGTPFNAVATTLPDDYVHAVDLDETNKTYTVEIKVPNQSDSSYSVGDIIGLNFCVRDDLDGNGVLSAGDAFCAWSVFDVKPSLLGKVLLTDEDTDVTSAPEPTTPASSSSKASSATSSSAQSSSVQSSSESVSDSTGSSASDISSDDSTVVSVTSSDDSTTESVDSEDQESDIESTTSDSTSSLNSSDEQPSKPIGGTITIVAAALVIIAGIVGTVVYKKKKA